MAREVTVVSRAPCIRSISSRPGVWNGDDRGTREC